MLNRLLVCVRKGVRKVFATPDVDETSTSEDGRESSPHAIELQITEDEPKSQPRPSALPKLSSPKSPKSFDKFEDPALDANTVIAQVKSKTKDGKYADLVTSEIITEARKAGSPDRDDKKGEPLSYLPRPLSPKAEPMAILSSLGYLKQSDSPPKMENDQGPKSPGRDVTCNNNDNHADLTSHKDTQKSLTGKTTTFRKVSEGRSSPLKRPLETLPEVETNVLEQNGCHSPSPTSVSPRSPRRSGQFQHLEHEGSVETEGSPSKETGPSEDDEDSLMQSEDIDLHIEESSSSELSAQRVEITSGKSLKSIHLITRNNKNTSTPL